MTTEDQLGFGARRTWAILLAVIVLVLLAGGYGFYRAEALHIYLDKHSELAAIGKLKASQIAQWRRERLDNAGNAAESPFFVKGVETWLKDPGNLVLRDEFLRHLKLEQRTEDVTDALLLDVDGRILLAAKDDPCPVGAATMKAVAQALAGKQAALSDLFRCSDGNVCIDAVAPVRDADNRPIAVVVLRSDARKFLYPLIQSWPIPSRSAETVLVRRDGDDVLFLNELRHRAGAALSLRIPLTQSDNPGVQAVRGERAMFEGKDYRGVEVLADLRPVPGSAWFMVATVDKSEILAEAQYRAAVIAVFVVLFILLSAALVALLHRQRQARLYRDLYASEREKRKAEELLRESVEEHRTILQTAMDGFWVADTQGRLLEVNETYCQMSGYSAQELLAMRIPDLEAAETDDDTAAHIQEIMAQGEDRFESRHRRKDGSIFDVAVSVQYRPVEGGRLVAFLQDITERKRAKEALRERSDLLQSVLDNSESTVTVRDREGRYLLANRRFQRLMGKSADQIIGATPHDIHPLDVASRILEEDRQVLKSGKPRGIESRIVVQNEERILLGTKVPLLNKDGEAYAVSTVAIDITERKRAEDAFRIQAQVLESMAEGVHVADENGVIFLVNPAFAAMFGYEPAELIGKRVSVLNAYPPDENDRFVAGIMEQLRARGRWSGEFANVRKDGSRFTCSAHISSLDLHGRLCWVSVQGDITDRKALERDREAVVALLSLINSDNDTHELIRLVIGSLQEWSRCEAVGIRLRQGDDFPYFETRGFPAEFVLAENRLCAVDQEGELVRDSAGDPVLECMCGKVISGRSDLSKPFFTQQGSFWTNSTTQLLADTSEADRGTLTRNRCNGEGFESVALIPLRSGGTTLGLLQFNDKQKGRFTPKLISFLEEVASELGIGLAQRRTAEALRENEERLRAVIQASMDAIVAVDGQGQIILFNAAAEEMFGLPATKVLGRPLELIIPPSIRERHRLVLSAFLSDGVSRCCHINKITEHGARRADGTVFPLELSLSVGRANGQRLVVAVMRDITERRRAEEALRQEQALLRALMSGTPDRIYFKDTASRFVRVNQAMARLFGLSDPAQAIGKSDADFFSEPHALKALADEQRIIQTGEPLAGIEEKETWPDGSEGWVSTSKAPLRDNEGRLVGTCGISRDITKRKRAEEALRRQKEMLQIIFDSAPVMIAFLDREARHHFVNHCWQSTLGWSLDEAMHEDVLAEFYPDPAYREYVVDYIKRAAGSWGDFRTRTRDGRVLDTSWINVALSDGSNIGIGIDITERKRVEGQLHADREQLRSLARQLSIAEERERRRIAAYLHDQIGQILAVASMKLSVLKETTAGRPGEQLDEIRGLLDTAIRDSRSLTFELGSPILYELGLEPAVEWLAERVEEEHGIKVDSRDDRRPKPLDDEMRILLYRATRELLHNVAKHSQASEAKVSLQRKGEEIQVTVEDAGIGFDPAIPGLPASKAAGFGLLSIRERLRHVGGSMEIVSRPGHGTKVTLTAPLKHDSATTKEKMK